MQSNYVRIIEQTHKDKVKTYMKCSKRELIEMLIECNKAVKSQSHLLNEFTHKDISEEK